VDVITGLIKANIPTRIAFSVASLVDSRTILDMSGAEKLLGRGDMLFTSAELSKPKRLQGAFSSDEDIRRVIEHLKESGEPEYLDAVVEKSSGPSGINIPGSDNSGDDLLPEAKRVILQAGKASASLLQRRLSVGYARAARILDLLEEQGFIGPGDGAKPREILAREIDETDAPDEAAEAENEDEVAEADEDGV
jgi:S-DNA-T family DNA segregation ATPase FtsK/SpoIIIE